IEVVGYNINSYYTLDQPSFLSCEVEQNGNVTAYTSGSIIKCYEFQERVQKVQRYSFQRPFIEVYRINQLSEDVKMHPDINLIEQEIEIVENKNYIARDVRYPNYELLLPSELVECGKADFTYQKENIFKDRSYVHIRDSLKGYQINELNEHLSTELQNISFIRSAKKEDVGTEYQLEDSGYITLSFPYNATGMIGMEVICENPVVLYYMFDEILTNGDIDTTRMSCCNGVKYYLEPGSYNLLTFEPYTFKYLKVVTTGKCKIRNIHVREYKHPKIEREIKSLKSNKKLEKIYNAAVESFLANAVDVLTDCPSRERAGWLCDSFFTGRVEFFLTGNNILEKSFLNNIIMAKEFPNLPEGMLPMCYPADHYDGTFIPNWAMWFVLELEEYYHRTKDRELIDEAKEKVYQLKNYFQKFENEYGLLEKLESWVFIEWSKASEFVQDINFPSNMIYAKMLETIGTLYDDSLMLDKSEKLKELIRERSFQGTFFTDNEIRTKDGLINPNNTTEVCQYYAFFTGVASKETYPNLWNTLVNDFGPDRKQTNKYPDVHFANAFIGNYLRLEILYNYGYRDKVLKEIEGYFYSMSELTGTLWEHDNTSASCNHGFASHVICWMI
ncbi:MAG TPA: hypothetical protein VHP81_00805, partial [Lachnospiraceae bacterium]|nr:hypothetical protein [Lachnospiraceae bacterium]